MNDDLIPMTTALISVTDKTGLEPFVLALKEISPKFQILASGGTAQAISKTGMDVLPIQAYTGFPECFGGRVKTLHPKVIGGILYRRDRDHEEAKQLNVKAVDLVICNLYDFEAAVQKQDADFKQMVEFMDIGGSTLIRSAAKNYRHVAVIVDPADYAAILEEIQTQDGKISLETRKKLAVKAMKLSAHYESVLACAFSKYLSGEQIERPSLTQGRELRYGENPDQKGWVYQFEQSSGIAQAKVLSGKELSYNNYEDATLAYQAVQELKKLGALHGAAIVKHGSLCGYATGLSLSDAFQKAWEGDAKSAFGSVIALSSPVPEEFMLQLSGKFVEVLIAPEFHPAFVSLTQIHRPNMRLLEPDDSSIIQNLLYKGISGGMLVQTQKKHLFSSFDALFQPRKEEEQRGVVTKRQPMPFQQELFAFAVAAANYAKSNAVAIVREVSPKCCQLLGIGVGQPNRIDCLERLALPKAIENLKMENPKCNTEILLGNCILASDGFFPFDDVIRLAAAQGIVNCIQPGGSVNDPLVIQAADALNMCMIFTGERYFFH